MFSVDSGWNEPVLRTIFLNADILMELSCCDDQVTFDILIELAIHLDQLIQRQSKISDAVCTTALHASPEPMQISCTWISITEREKQQCEGWCFYCGNAEYLISSCPLYQKTPIQNDSKNRAPVASHPALVSQFLSLSHKSLMLPMQIEYSGSLSALTALMDSGAAGHFIEHHMAA